MIIDFSRRGYSTNGLGERILVGLTAAETREFELLDAEKPVDEYGRLLRWEITEEQFPPNQARWLELYNKHKAAQIIP